jgi:hypothetical protein
MCHGIHMSCLLVHITLASVGWMIDMRQQLGRQSHTISASDRWIAGRTAQIRGFEMHLARSRILRPPMIA